MNYASAKGLQYVEDSSNSQNKYTRNSFRNQILPLIQEQFPQIEDNIKTNIQRLNDVAFIYHEANNKLKKDLLQKVGEEFQIAILKLKKTNPLNTIIWEIFKDFNFTSHQISEIIKLLDASNGASIKSSSHQILKNRNWLIISKIAEKNNTHFLISEICKKRELFY